jgi:ABC-type transporter MlaC component
MKILIGCVACKEEAKNEFVMLIGKSEGKWRFWDISVNGIILLKWMLKKYGVNQ